MRALSTTFATLLFMVLASCYADCAIASTVTFTDPDTEVETSTVPLPADGRFAFRIVTNPKGETELPTAAVGVTDDTGQMAPGCYPMANDQTIAVTSEQVTATQPEITVAARAYTNDDCTGGESIMSNPIKVRFVPGAPGLTGPLAQ